MTKTSSRTNTVSAAELETQLRKEARGTIFSVGFLKRSNGEFRQMQCRFGVRSRLSGGEQGYDPNSKGLITVYDVVKRGYRTIPVEGILWTRVRGRVANYR